MQNKRVYCHTIGFLATSFLTQTLLAQEAVVADSKKSTPPASMQPAALPAQTWVWDKNPIPVVLPVGGERRIDFPTAVEFQAPADAAGFVKVDPLGDGTLYVHSLKPFQPTRFRARTPDGTTYFLDISASAAGQSQPLVIVDPHADKTVRSGGIVDAEQQSTGNLIIPAPASVGVDQLVQTAFRCVYGPSRFCASPNGVNRAELKGGSLPLYQTGELATVPVAAWRATTESGDQFATLVQLTNRAQDIVVVDPRRFNGHFSAAAFLFGRIAPGHDSYAVLVSDQPIDQAVSHE